MTASTETPETRGHAITTAAAALSRLPAPRTVHEGGDMMREGWEAWHLTEIASWILTGETEATPYAYGVLVPDSASGTRFVGPLVSEDDAEQVVGFHSRHSPSDPSARVPVAVALHPLDVGNG